MFNLDIIPHLNCQCFGRSSRQVTVRTDDNHQPQSLKEQKKLKGLWKNMHFVEFLCVSVRLSIFLKNCTVLVLYILADANTYHKLEYLQLHGKPKETVDAFYWWS